MVKQKITYYKMLTPELRVEIAAEMGATQIAVTAAAEEEACTEEEDITMEVGAEEASETPQATEAFETEQATILSSIQDEREVVVNLCHIHLADVRRERIFAELEVRGEEEKSELRPAANDHDGGSSGTLVTDISDDE